MQSEHVLDVSIGEEDTEQAIVVHRGQTGDSQVVSSSASEVSLCDS